MTSFDQQVQALVRQNIAGLTLGVVILAVGIAALVLLRLRSRAGERILLWFGLLATLYGIRLLARNRLIELMFGGPVSFWTEVIAYLDFMMVIPALLVAEEIYGKGWRSALRWAIWIMAAYGALGIALGLATGTPYVIPEPGVLLMVPVAIVFLLGRHYGYRAPPFADASLLVIGAAIFLAFVFNEHFGPQRYRVEPLGFFALICCLGLIAIRRVRRNELRLLAVEQEMASARRIQSSILPGHGPQIDGLTLVAKYSPMASVAGDFYDFMPVDSKGIGILVADVAGHGVPAALVASMVKVAIAAQQQHASDPARVISGLNQVFCRQRTGQLITAGYLFVDAAQHSAVYAGAGHPPLILLRKSDGKVHRYENNGLLLGVRPNATYTNVPIPISAGDRLLLYTDGLLEAANPAGETFDSQLDARISTHAVRPAHEFTEALVADLSAWSRPKGQEDDLTLVVIDIH
jgi:sigma-B regulation protein RsbU (phosphoserine phosphatase)